MVQNDSTRLRNKFKIINRLVYINADSLEKLYTNNLKDEALKIGNVTIQLELITIWEIIT